MMRVQCRARLWVRRGKEVSASIDRFCLAAGIETLGAMMEADAEVACGPRHSRSEDRRGHLCGRAQGKIGFHAGKVVIERPRVRGLNGQELPLESWSVRSMRTGSADGR
jgi:putative transposase